MIDDEMGKHALDKAKSAAKDPAGRTVEDGKEQPPGEADKAENSAKKATSDVKDAANKFVDAAKRK